MISVEWYFNFNFALFRIPLVWYMYIIIRRMQGGQWLPLSEISLISILIILFFYICVGRWYYIVALNRVYSTLQKKVNRSPHNMVENISMVLAEK